MIFVFLIFGQFFLWLWSILYCTSLIFSFLVFPQESNKHLPGVMVWCVGAVRSGCWARRRILHLCPLPCCLNASPLQGTKRTLTSLKIQTGPRVNPKREDSFPESKRDGQQHIHSKKEILCWKVPNMSWRVAQLLNACLGQKVTESQEVGLASLHWSHSSWSHHIRIPWSNSFGKSEDIPTFSQSSCSATDGYNTCIGCGLYGPAWSSPCRENLQSLWLEAA